MQKLTRRLLALLLAALLAAMALAPVAALAEDWRSQLLSAFGLEPIEETEAEPQPTAESGKASSAEDWTLPITEPQRIVNYLNAFGRLPDNFITKQEAQALGWDSRRNYVGDVAPGKSIGGNRFGNYEKRVPSKPGRTWFECDTEYTGKKRGATRLIYSTDGLYYYTSDHYKTFTQMFPEE